MPSARGYLQMLPGFDLPQAFEGLEGFSHLWVIFGFHACKGQWRSRVRPPRLGGNREVGVFATRSPFRPNGLGLSVLRFEGMQNAQGLRLHVSALDLLHGTPVYDIKPYVPYVDSIPDASGGFASDRPDECLEVMFSAQARQCLGTLPDGAGLAALIRQTLGLDPRPAYRQGDVESRLYGMRLGQFDVRWRVHTGQVVVEEIVPAEA